ncbi:hypothetical protein HNQ36_001639 [Afipia massiliensis]|uniref:Uncharacterized protein n=1 Tax=Afipia massiliensis TaxID=211460 RepID=A0A840MV94_9BRAD|nr:hypothetical protein [Afipia massiliensis]
MQASNLIVVASRYVAGALFIVTICFEIASLPLLLVGTAIMMGAPSLSNDTYFFLFLTILSPLVAAAFLAFVWSRLESHRQFYPHAALLLGLGWVTFLIFADKSSAFDFFGSYVRWRGEPSLWLARLYNVVAGLW